MQPKFLLALLMAVPSVCQTRNVWKSEGPPSLLDSGSGYSVRLETLDAPMRSAGEPVDQMLWIRRGAGRVSVGSVAGANVVATGDLVRLARGVAYEIIPTGGIEFVAIRINPLSAGRSAPPGIRPARGEMGTVVTKAEIDATISRTPANAPLHTQDNFTANFVLFKGRVGPWEAHVGCVDIYLVKVGAGRIQLGGSIDNPKEDSPGEPRGTGVSGSRENAVTAGDVLVIPRNMAHHMNPTRLPLAYVLIKVWAE